MPAALALLALNLPLALIAPVRPVVVLADGRALV
jgi:hypothetical protein